MEIKKGMILKAIKIPNEIWASVYYDFECPFYLVDKITKGPEDYIVDLIPLSKKYLDSSTAKNKTAIPVLRTYLTAVKRCFEVSSFEEATAYLL